MPVHSLLLGELPIKDAPSVSLPNGTTCLPQHYLFFEHDYASVCDLIVHIDYADRYPIFVCEDTTGIYVQIGIVGHDNYKSHTRAHCKMMYGRKWRIEPRLPTSEIIQTTFLALKKAREHEIRELFRLTHADGGVSTPFNNHHDLPLMATHQALLKPKHGETSGCFSKSEAEDVLINALAVCRYDGCFFKLDTCQKLNEDTWFVSLNIQLADTCQLPELKNTKIQILLNRIDANHIYYQLMDALIALSDRHVDEHFRYKNFARFSRQNHLSSIGDLSIVLRKGHEEQRFLAEFEHVNYETDLTRIPTLKNDRVAEKIRQQLQAFKVLLVI